MVQTRILLLYILTVFTSCQGQTSNSKSTEDAPGNTVREIPKSIWTIFQDQNKNYWFGSNGNGAYRYDGKNVTQYTTKDGLSSNQIRGIQQDKQGNIFFDTPNGVTKFDGQKMIALVPVKLSGQWKLHRDDLWFKGNGDIIGAYRYDGNTLRHLEFSAFDSNPLNAEHNVYSIYRDKQQNIWFGTQSAGVCRFDGQTLDWIYEKELSVLDDGRVPGVRSILEDKDGYFWFSNVLGRYKIQNHTKTQNPIGYQKLDGIPLQQQVKMELPYFNSGIIHNGGLWMTSYNEGVWKYDDKLTNYRIKDGATNVLIVSIYKDNSGDLWLATDNAGVYKFNGSTFEKFRLL